jgi:hypothetical protein
MTDQPATSTEHASHDLTLVAALAARDHGLAPGELAQAKALLASCADCTDLLADLAALAAAVPTAAIPERPRSFALTAADAARLRPAGWRRFLKAIGSARDGITFPLAMGLTTLGMAGLLVATIPTLAGPTQLDTLSGPAAAGASAAAAAPQSQETLAMSAEPAQSGDQEGGVFTGGDDEGDAAASPGDRNALSAEEIAIRDDPTGLSVLVVVAGALLILGLGLFALRWSARRL